ncbi:Exopolysaccharide synthesis ExoD [Pseudoxanthomonas suwonensis 11-1]|uniref:Exopolysaccharide synthesis ExoD n=1 Tax=Pseudoxanthomonas suwonensis (strain 11-1) TaxID=743721 RepID=E6WUK4_PSEUU|nr:exopolysaccharide biosynthesis protein [Pseudoxanthomonas suwonensis]ADV27706.1 Exopolysaccharide synthesis ExoD [Pseudoxanthomonas suwonensis 11-1]
MARPTDPAGPTPARSGLTRLLDGFAQGDPDELLTLDHLLGDLGRSAFGMFLFVSILPGFIPVPGAAGVVAGPLVVLIGLQLIAGLSRPWLPRFVGRRGPRRSTLNRFRQRIAPWLGRLEHLVRPRLQGLAGNRAANALTGLLMAVLGVLLALPIPMTNYVFAGLLLLFALALLERDGALLLCLWLVSATTIGVMAVVSGELAALVGQWIDRLG